MYNNQTLSISAAVPAALLGKRIFLEDPFVLAGRRPWATRPHTSARVAFGLVFGVLGRVLSRSRTLPPRLRAHAVQTLGRASRTHPGGTRGCVRARAVGFYGLVWSAKSGCGSVAN
mgnify:CR=1 FL=1